MILIETNDTVEVNKMQQIEEPQCVISQAVYWQISDKYRALITLNQRKTSQEIRKTVRKGAITGKQVAADDTRLNIRHLLQYSTKEEKTREMIGKKGLEELPQMKSWRRERLKKTGNPVQILSHYIDREGFKPGEEKLQLLQQLIELKVLAEKQSSDLEKIYEEIYRLMNQAVDVNEMRFLSLLILLAASICNQAKDLKRAMYFYNQARVFATYADMTNIKIEALMAMAGIAQEAKLYSESTVLLKKALQYAWKDRNAEVELQIYESIGTNFYLQGDIQTAKYYHMRFMQGKAEHTDSAIKKISAEMLLEFDRNINALEKQNLTTLFLEYINIPVTNPAILPVRGRRTYSNYDQNGLSPRRRKVDKRFEAGDFTDVAKQLAKLLNDNLEFKTEIPLPNVHKNLMAIGQSEQDNFSFQKSRQFHQIFGEKHPTVNLNKMNCNSLEKRVQKALSERVNPNWWQDMLQRLRKDRQQKIGQLKERIRNSQQQESPEKKRHAQSQRCEQIKKSFNRTLIDWIDPLE